MYRTNLFEYCDEKRIEKDSIDNNVLCTQNGQKVSLIGKKKDILNVLKNCFDNDYDVLEDADVILVNC
jgi:hypothetical protein